MLLLSQIINGLQLGSIYALIALGYSMVYGIIMLLNFAHGDIIMVGGYVAMLTIAAGVHPLLAVVLAILACMALGVVIDKVAYAPLRSSPRISLLITAIGVSFLLENLAQNIWGANARPFPNSAIIQGSALHIGGVQIGITAIVTIVVSVLSMVALTFLVQKTKRGKAMRAVSEDMGTAQLMGINVNNTITFTFAVGSALAGIGSILYCCTYPQVSPTMGSMLGLKAFVAAVLGGIGSLPGAVLGGLVIGVVQSGANTYISSSMSDTFVYLILIVVLMIRPAGILGKNVGEKV